MRLWSIHPKYLDKAGLGACWRESLLAKKVLEGKTVGYKNHPQLDRFKASKNTLGAINFYLSEICNHANLSRKYAYNQSKIDKSTIININPIDVNTTQIKYEFEHLLKKLTRRDTKHLSLVNRYLEFDGKILPHPLFTVVSNDSLESWEKLTL